MLRELLKASFFSIFHARNRIDSVQLFAVFKAVGGQHGMPRVGTAQSIISLVWSLQELRLPIESGDDYKQIVKNESRQSSLLVLPFSQISLFVYYDLQTLLSTVYIKPQYTSPKIRRQISDCVCSLYKYV